MSTSQGPLEPVPPARVEGPQLPSARPRSGGAGPVSGGRAATLLGLAGAGDLFVTSLGGRNGRFGRLLGSGQSPERALRAIGSTVEGIGNTTAALGLAQRFALELPTARAVDLALREQIMGDEGLLVLRELFATAVTNHHASPAWRHRGG